MAEHRLGIVMNGVTGRMGTNQHLVRSILAIRAQGGVALANGDRVMPDPILVGRNEAKVRALAEAHGIARWTTDLDAALANPDDSLFFDAASTQLRAGLIDRAIAAGKDVYTEKPVADTLADAVRVAKAADAAGIRHGVVQDKIFLPGLLKLRELHDAGFFGRILSVRGEFGYWVFEGDLQPTQRPSWNYKTAEGGGIILDMLCHWRYVLDNTVAPVKAVSCLGAVHLPKRWDESDQPYDADADDAAYATFLLDGAAIGQASDVVVQMNSSWCTRVRRDDLVTFHVDGTHGDAEAGVESRRAADHGLPLALAGGAGDPRLRQRLQGAVGAVRPPPVRPHAVEAHAVGGGQGRAARRGRAPELAGTPLGRYRSDRRLGGERS
jgi:predicted dehydrogenase